VRTFRLILKVALALWRFLEQSGVKPTNNAAERALRPAVIHRKLSYGVQSQRDALCQCRHLFVTPILKQQGRDVMAFTLLPSATETCEGVHNQFCGRQSTSIGHGAEKRRQCSGDAVPQRPLVMKQPWF
jgi:hypothetical protein